MKLFVQLMDDDGKVLAEHTADPCQPSRWNAPTVSRFVGKMPQNASDVVNNGTYELFGITFQPHLKVDRPNGWSAPAPAPNTAIALPAGFPTIPGRPTYPYNKNPAPWSTSAPTPSQSAMNLMGSAPQSR